ncbi:MAG TPA: hypothetical protein VN837_04290 [Chloroflexota bacterium]|nr:hypothetical protein [Chloroflexota bacterium]
MPLPIHLDDPTEYMVAMAAIMIVGTAVGAGSVFIEKGVESTTAQFPAVILTCPRTTIDDMTISPAYQANFSIQVAYLDRWESSARTLEQCLADAKTALYQMARNIRATPDLGFNLTVQASLHQEIRVNQVTTDLGLGFPLVTGTLINPVKSQYFY